MTNRTLKGLRVLILEDDYFQAQDSRDLLESAGAEVVAVGGKPPDLAALLQRGPIDAGLIDINLGQDHSFDFARALRGRAIPFIFLTGYDASILPEDLAGSTCISKPADGGKVLSELARIAGR